VAGRVGQVNAEHDRSKAGRAGGLRVSALAESAAFECLAKFRHVRTRTPRADGVVRARGGPAIYGRKQAQVVDRFVGTVGQGSAEKGHVGRRLEHRVSAASE
jgi:hypothetical protein